MITLVQKSGWRVWHAITLLNGSREDIVSSPTWRQRCARWLLAFATILLAYQVYAFSCVPLLERDMAVAQPTEFQKEDQGMPVDPRILQLFPEGSWERDNPKVLRTSGGMLLFQDYRKSSGRVDLKPCTVVVFAPSRGEQRPVMLRAPDGAVLNFSGSMNLSRAEIGRLQGARLDGAIEISSPPSAPGADDALKIITKNVQIKPREIWTPHDVQFYYGPHHGRGRDLSITLTTDESEETSGPSDSTLGNLESLELVHIDKLVMHVPGDGLLENQSDLRPLPGRPAPPAARPSGKTTQVEVTCQGPFQFNFGTGIASFEDYVDVVRMNPEGPSDQLNCQQLQIHFNMQREEAAAPEADSGHQDGLGIEVKRIVAEGLPVTLRAPSSQTAARCGRLEYDFQTRTITLSDREQSHFTYRQHQIEAPELAYTLREDPKRLGLLRASGPGTYQGLVAGQADRNLVARWVGDLQLRPQGPKYPDLHVMSVANGANISLERTGKFSAGEMHVWMREAPAAGPEGKDARIQVEPVKMLAVGNVQVDSDRLGGHTERLEVWFDTGTDSPPDAPQRSADERPSASNVLTEPDQTAEDDGGANKKLDFAGDLVRLHVLMSRPKPRLREAAIVGKVRLSQDTAKPGVQPLVITGDMLQLKVDTMDRAVADVHGAPALVQAQGLIMQGSSLHLSQRENRMWADGPGRMKLSSDNPALPEPQERPQTPVWIAWQGGMNFDGQLVRFQRQVEVTGVHTLDNGDRLHLQIDGHELQATFNRYVAFQQPKRQADLDIAELRFVGEVFAENQTFDAQGQLASHDRMTTHDLHLDRVTGQFQGQGPGWVSTVRYNDGDPRESTGVEARQGPRKLIFLRVDYQNIVSGNVERREVSFGHQVRTVYGPINSWDQQLDPNRRGGLGPDGIVMNCQQLSVAEMKDGDLRSAIMKAVGKTTVEGSNFTAVGDRLSYAESKDLLILEADDRGFAQIEQRTRPGEPPSRFSARKIMYWPRSGQIQVDGGGQADYFHSNSPANQQMPSARIQ